MHRECRVGNGVYSTGHVASIKRWKTRKSFGDWWCGEENNVDMYGVKWAPYSHLQYEN